MPSPLLTGAAIGAWTLPNRVVMAPMTRARAGADGVPTPDMVTYYSQRATAGLIIAEASNVAASSGGWGRSPGLYTADQVRGWQRVTASVHRAGGRILAQLFHVGRVGATVLNGCTPLSPSGIDDGRERLSVWGELSNGGYGRLLPDESRALLRAEIDELVEVFGRAGERAADAGFDGVELHAGNGYLLHEFLSTKVNQRDHEYGGSVENRSRLVLEILDRLSTGWGDDRVGLRITPFTTYNDAPDASATATYRHLAEQVSARRLAFLEAADMDAGRGEPHLAEILGILRPHLDVPLVVNGGLTPDRAADLIAAGHAELASFGWLYLANPDLVDRIARRASLAEPHADLPHRGMFGGGRAGYSDYPALPPAKTTIRSLTPAPTPCRCG